ncbi:hypothetical protein [Xanthomonas prunicola]|uniref:hypothetical protein n=1 Tax=Xanthomonas prunicola TaxID=2053930 RepID=UPI001B807D2C|nr:hypothetical protein [Xanthomonas prunicola]
MKKLSPRPLAHFVDQLTVRPGISLSESTEASVTINGASAADAVTLAALLTSLNWDVKVVDDAEYDVPLHALHAGLEPYAITFQKPLFNDGIGFVTTKAFHDWLLINPKAEGVVRVASSTVCFCTMGFVVCSWDEVGSSKVREGVKSPRDLVRSIGTVNPLPQDIRPFLLTDSKNLPWGDLAFDAWMLAACRATSYSVAAEVEVSKVTFTGPPRLDLDLNEGRFLDDLGSVGFLALQAAALWIYELDRESEVRHRIFTHEFARIAERGRGLGKALAESCALALDGAKITYQYGLHEQSKDAIKGLGELRKSVVEDTAKTTEAARQLALSAAGALFYSLGLIAGKITTSISPLLLDAMGILGILYLGSIIGINFRFLSQQRVLRDTWRRKLYRYLTESEYNDLVGVPVRSAELSLCVALFASSFLGLVMFICVILNNHYNFFFKQ